jgi:hypothetical protein
MSPVWLALMSHRREGGQPKPVNPLIFVAKNQMRGRVPAEKQNMLLIFGQKRCFGFV